MLYGVVSATNEHVIYHSETAVRAALPVFVGQAFLQPEPSTFCDLCSIKCKLSSADPGGRIYPCLDRQKIVNNTRMNLYRVFEKKYFKKL